MRTIIAGSRNITDIEVVGNAVNDAGWWPTVVLSGTARGVDRLGEQWADLWEIPVERYPAQWDVFGRSAGYRRNAEMAANAEALIAVWDGESAGTRHMIDIARKCGLMVYIAHRGNVTTTAT